MRCARLKISVEMLGYKKRVLKCGNGNAIAAFINEVKMKTHVEVILEHPPAYGSKGG